jgi:hypothetical protein
MVNPGEMLIALSSIWVACTRDYPEADLDAILSHVEALQMLIFPLERKGWQ